MMIYVGPDQVIPLSGILGMAAGFGLMFWGKVLQGFRKMASLISSRSENQEKTRT